MREEEAKCVGFGLIQENFKEGEPSDSLMKKEQAALGSGSVAKSNSPDSTTTAAETGGSQDEGSLGKRTMAQRDEGEFAESDMNPSASKK